MSNVSYKKSSLHQSVWFSIPYLQLLEATSSKFGGDEPIQPLSGYIQVICTQLKTLVMLFITCFKIFYDSARVLIF